jgi:hypothetical protein
MNTEENRTKKAINVHDTHRGISDYLPKESLKDLDVVHELYAHKKTKFVLQLLEPLLKQYHNDPYMVANIGYIFFFCDKRQRAYDMLKQNFELNPNNIYAQCYFVRVCILMNKLEEAFNAFNGKLVLEELFPERTDFTVAELSEILFSFGLFFSKVGLMKSVFYNLTQLEQFLPPQHPYVQELQQELKSHGVNIQALKQEIEKQKAARLEQETTQE